MLLGYEKGQPEARKIKKEARKKQERQSKKAKQSQAS